MAGAKTTARTKRKQPSKQSKAAPRARAKPQPAKVRSRAPAPTAAKRPVPASARAGEERGFAVDKLHQVALTAINLDAAVAFYRDVLGLRFVTRFDPPGLAFFNLGGGLRLMLSATASSATLYFLVDEIEAAVRDLRKRGVQFLQPPHMIHRDEAGEFGKKRTEEWMAFFRDPSGNLLGLVERR